MSYDSYIQGHRAGQGARGTMPRQAPASCPGCQGPLEHREGGALCPRGCYVFQSMPAYGLMDWMRRRALAAEGSKWKNLLW